MPMYLTKSLASQSSALGSISTAGTPVITIISSALDTQRRVTFSTTTAGDYSGLAITVRGTQQGGNTITETVWGSTTSTTAWTTTQDFLTLSSVSVSSTPGLPVYIQTSAVGGTPWILANTCTVPSNIGFGVTFSSTRTPMSAVLEYSYDNPPGQGIQNTNSSWASPYPITSTSISTAANTNSAGVCLLPIACWRVSVTSTSTAGTTTTSSLKVFVSALQAGLGSGL